MKSVLFSVLALSFLSASPAFAVANGDGAIGGDDLSQETAEMIDDILEELDPQPNIDEFEVDLEALKRKLKELLKKSKEVRTARGKTVVRKFKAWKDAYDAFIKEINAAIAAAQAAGNSSLAGKLEDLKEDAEDDREDMYNDLDNKAELELIKNYLEEVIEKLEERIEEIDEKLETATGDEKAALLAEKAVLEGQVDSLQSEIAAVEEELEQLEDRKDAGNFLRGLIP